MRPPRVEAVFFPTSLCVGFLFLMLYPAPPPPPPASSSDLLRLLLSHTTLSHSLSHTTLSRTTCSHIALSHTTLSHTLFHTLWHTNLSHTTCSHTDTTLSHTLFHTQLFHTQFFPLDLRFAWQAWRLLIPTFVLRGRRGTYDTGLALVARLGAVSRPCAALCVAGVALGDIDVSFAWHLGTCTLRVSPSLSNKTLSQTILSHTVFHTHTHTHLSHMQLLSHTHLCHIQLCQTQSFTHNFVTLNSAHTTFQIIDPPPSPLSFLLSQCASTTFSDYWKKLTCGVIQSFIFFTHYSP